MHADDDEGPAGVTLHAAHTACPKNLSSGQSWQLIRPVLRAVHMPSLFPWETMLGLKALHLEYCDARFHKAWSVLPSAVRHIW